MRNRIQIYQKAVDQAEAVVKRVMIIEEKRVDLEKEEMTLEREAKVEGIVIEAVIKAEAEIEDEARVMKRKNTRKIRKRIRKRRKVKNLKKEKTKEKCRLG